MHEREMITPAHPTADQRPFSNFIKLYHLYMMKIALITKKKKSTEKAPPQDIIHP